jgi:hypothetical protein
MLSITIPAFEAYDERTGEFISFVGQTLELEHSLVSLSKWESKWHKPFLSKEPMNAEETLDYIRCMTITTNVDPKAYDYMSQENLEAIRDYINDPMTATTFGDDKRGKGGREIITNEIIYYWMVALQIPSEYQYWHLNHLLTLIRVCNIKNQPPKKMGKKQIMSRYADINAARRKQMNTTG